MGELEGMEFWVFGYRMFLDHFLKMFKEEATQVFDHRNFFGQFKNGNVLVIRWFWSNLEESLKVRVKALCGYRGLLV